ncbi:MAG: T9SS type A sorting domain-containing protein [Bacteroidales bacterium]|nr:T9SS type A sorting domain-containing protein [Bacteroidales bacterium]
MKRYLLLLLVVALGTAASAQIIYQQDFDSFNAGDYLAVVDTDWTTWSNSPGGAEDPLISSDQSSSAPNSVVVEGTNDAVYPINNLTAGYYTVSFKYYVPTGFNGYFNLLQMFAGASSEWGMQVFFDVGGAGSIDGGAQTAATFTYPYDTWMEIECIVDLDTDWAEFYIDGTLIHGYVWSTGTFGTGTLNQLGGVNFYAWGDNGPPKYYFDDFKFETQSSALYADDFESYNVGDFLAVENPTWWTTWTNNPGSAEDAPISDAFANSGSQSVLVEGATDAILKLGDKTSGKYQLNFYYYILGGFGGYYNIQHYESPGIEWAYEIYFSQTGTAELFAGEATAVTTFSFPHDTWFFLDNIIDLDKDSAYLYVDGTKIYQWQFSVVANGGFGANQLGGMDLFAGAPTGETPRFYMDDMQFIELVGPSGNPTIAVSPTSMTEALDQGATTTEPLTLSNSGTGELTYDIFITYQGGPTDEVTSTLTSTKEIVLRNTVRSPELTNGGSPAPSDDVILNYDGDNTSAIGLTNGGEMKSAAMFPVTMVSPYIGMEMISVDVYINDPPTSTKLIVYDYGLPNIPGPGDLAYEEQWASSPGAWNTVTLSSPIVVEGGDLWVGYAADHVAGTFPSGVDAGPANPNGDWISTGPGWHHLSDNPDLNFNWNIRAKLTGDPIEQWLSVSPSSGTIAVGASEDVDVTFDATALDPGLYEATIVVNNNDPNNSQVDVDVTLDVITGIIEMEKTAVMIYPNPVSDYLNISSDDNIIKVELVNLMGQVIYTQLVDNNNHNINLSNVMNGVYIIKVDTKNGTVTRRIAVE